MYENPALIDGMTDNIKLFQLNKPIWLGKKNDILILISTILETFRSKYMHTKIC